MKKKLKEDTRVKKTEGRQYDLEDNVKQKEKKN